MQWDQIKSSYEHACLSRGSHVICQPKVNMICLEKWAKTHYSMWPHLTWQCPRHPETSSHEKKKQNKDTKINRIHESNDTKIKIND